MVDYAKESPQWALDASLELGAWLKFERERVGLTQEDFIALLKEEYDVPLTIPVIRKIEHGKTPLKLWQVVPFAWALGIDPQEIFRRMIILTKEHRRKT